jgi:hypothetical protein
MADNDRAIYFCVNIGISLPEAPLARALFGALNVGLEALEVEGRGLAAPVNVGFSDNDVAGRALYATLSVHDFSDPNDGIEVQLISADLLTVEYNLAAK